VRTETESFGAFESDMHVYKRTDARLQRVAGKRLSIETGNTTGKTKAEHPSPRALSSRISPRKNGLCVLAKSIFLDHATMASLFAVAAASMLFHSLPVHPSGPLATSIHHAWLTRPPSTEQQRQQDDNTPAEIPKWWYRAVSRATAIFGTFFTRPKSKRVKR